MLALVMAAALQADAQLHVRAVLEPEAGRFQRFVQWRRTPTLDELDKAYPAGQHGRLGAALKCSVEQTGRLGSCDVWTTYPSGPAVKAAALSLIQEFQVTPEFTKAALENGSKVVFDIMFTPKGDDDAPFVGNDCPAPFCTPVPPPLALTPPARE